MVTSRQYLCQFFVQVVKLKRIFRLKYVKEIDFIANYYLYPTRLQHMPTTSNKNSTSIGLQSHTKGIELEGMFCEYMKNELGYHKARTLAQVLSDSNNRGTNVDVIAELVNASLRYVKLCFYLLMFLAVSYSVLSLYLAEENEMQNAIYVFCVSAVILFCGIVTIIIYEKKNIQHGWAECKNQKEAISTELMQIAEMRFNSYKSQKIKSIISPSYTLFRLTNFQKVL